MTLVLDTSLILELFRYRRLDMIELRQISGGPIVVPASVARELRKLGKGAILSYLSENGCTLLPGKASYGDREIKGLVQASREPLIIGTQDFAFVRDKLKVFKGKFRHLFLRGKRKLVISGGN